MVSEIYSFESRRLVIRQLEEADNVDNYLNWMQDNANSFIESVNSRISKSDLYKYINEKNSKPDCIFLGIFDKRTCKHIGNGKFEPINLTEKFAVMGLFIGDVDFRGKGIAKEFIECCVQNILLPIGIEKILLGVNKQNVNAIKAYCKSGFRITKVPSLDIGIDSIELELQL